MSDDSFPEKKNDPAEAASFPVAGAVVGSEPHDADEPMTDVQSAKLRDLSAAADEPMDGNLTRAQADARIQALEDKTGK